MHTSTLHFVQKQLLFNLRYLMYFSHFLHWYIWYVMMVMCQRLDHVFSSSVHFKSFICKMISYVLKLNINCTIQCFCLVQRSLEPLIYFIWGEKLIKDFTYLWLPQVKTPPKPYTLEFFSGKASSVVILTTSIR